MKVLSSRLLLLPSRINHKNSYLRESSATAWTLIAWDPFLHTKSASLSLGAIIGIKVPSIAPMTFGKAAIVKKILLIFCMSSSLVENLILSSCLYMDVVTSSIARQTLDFEIPWRFPHWETKDPFLR